MKKLLFIIFLASGLCSCSEKNDAVPQTKTYAINTYGHFQNVTWINDQQVTASNVENYQYAATLKRGDKIKVRIYAGRDYPNDPPRYSRIQIEDAGIIVYKNECNCDQTYIFTAP